MNADRHPSPAPRALRPLALVASLAVALVVVQVPPCGMSTEACAAAARPAAGAHCPMATIEASSGMECCFEDGAPVREPAPAVPAAADELRLQLKAPAASPASALAAILPAALPAPAAAAPAAPALPLFTLLSTLLI